MASTGRSSGGRRRTSTEGRGGFESTAGKKARRPTSLGLEIFKNPNLLAYDCWENKLEIVDVCNCTDIRGIFAF